VIRQFLLDQTTGATFTYPNLCCWSFLIEGNYMGTDFTGTQALGNGSGLAVIDGASNNTIGGTTAGARNGRTGQGEVLPPDGAAAPIGSVGIVI
jgi:hypothetical protein